MDINPPGDLGPAGLEQWHAILSRFEPEPWHVPLLRAYARAADIAEKCAERVAEEGLTVTNRFGELVSHPAVVEQRLNTTNMRTLLKSLELDGGEPAPEDVRGQWGQPLTPGSPQYRAKVRELKRTGGA
jgi:phage terminase small subunit